MQHIPPSADHDGWPTTILHSSGVQESCRADRQQILAGYRRLPLRLLFKRLPKSTRGCKYDSVKIKPSTLGEAPAASAGEVSHRRKTQTAIPETDEQKRNHVTQDR
jgi:hypothetical protein